MNVSSISPQTQPINRVPRQTKAIGFKAMLKLQDDVSPEALQKLSQDSIKNFPGIKAFSKNIIYYAGRFFDINGKQIPKPEPQRIMFTRYVYDNRDNFIHNITIRLINTLHALNLGKKSDFHLEAHPPLSKINSIGDFDKIFKNYTPPKRLMIF